MADSIEALGELEVSKRWSRYLSLSMGSKIVAFLASIAAALSTMIPFYFFSTPTRTIPSVVVFPELNEIFVVGLIFVALISFFISSFADRKRFTYAEAYRNLTGMSREKFSG